MKRDGRKLPPREMKKRETRALKIRMELGRVNRSMAWLGREAGVSSQFVNRCLNRPFPKFTEKQFDRFLETIRTKGN